MTEYILYCASIEKFCIIINFLEIDFQNMSNNKRTRGRKVDCVSYKKKKSVKKNSVPFPQQRKDVLAASDKGSFYVDKKRINESDYKSKLTVRQKRRERKSRKTKKMDAFKHVEGTQYKSQQFI